ncbi:MAG: branched-chain amino acid transporter, amino acid-binding protein [Fibrobacteres bacterium]|nr:branched-chain amino acid transporter, amino acid-binding protein [Fibrobacterota bacterium]
MFLSNMKSLRTGIIPVLAMVLLAGLSACNKKDAGSADNEILIGHYGSLTGATATFGQSAQKGIEMAVDAINASGGVLGKKLKVLVEDDQGNPIEAQTAVTKLINKDRVVAVLGEIASSNSLAAAPVAQQNRIPMISPGSTNPKVTAVGDYIFRVCFIDPFQGLVMAKFATNTLKLKNVAVLRDIKSDYSVGLANFFVENFTKMGGTIVTDISYSQGDKDFTAQLTAIKAKNPDGIFVPGYYTEVGLLARQARKLGIKVTLLGGDGWDSSKLWEIGGDALNGCYYSNHYSVDDPSPILQKFVADYKAKYKGTSDSIPDAMAALGYDAALILADAMKRANSTRPDSVRDALAQTKGFMGVTGNTTLDENRNAVKPAVVLEVVVDAKGNGKNVFKETVSP